MGTLNILESYLKLALLFKKCALGISNTCLTLLLYSMCISKRDIDFDLPCPETEKILAVENYNNTKSLSQVVAKFFSSSQHLQYLSPHL